MCGPPRRIGEGDVVAFSWPDVYLSDPDTGRIRRHDLDTGHTVAEPRIPESASFPAAFADTLAWVEHQPERLVVSYGATTRIIDGLPDPGAHVADVTIGRRLAVYSVRPMPDGPDTAASVVIDLRSGERVELASEAFVAGD